MARILFVSISFPPKSDAEGLQVAKYFRYLSQHKDLVIDVVTTPIPTLYMPFDADLVSYAEGVDQLIEVAVKENRLLNIIRNRLGLDRFVFPDSRYSFFQQYNKVLSSLRNRPDIIYSRSDPKSSTLMAYRLKTELQVPWIMHLSDPWADCPISRMSAYTKQKNQFWENRCVETADIITLTSQPTVDHFINKYPHHAAKFKLFPNVYELIEDTVPSTQVSTSKNKKFRIVFTGSMAAERSPEYLLKPIFEAYQRDKTLGDHLEVVLAGEADAQNRKVISDYAMPFVKWLGKISYKEALALQRTANYLVVIDNPIADASQAVFFPSKLLDYMLARRRILAITSTGSATWQVMQDLTGDTCQHEEPAKVEQYIYLALNAFQAGNIDYLESVAPPTRYEAKYNADRLYAELKQLLNA